MLFLSFLILIILIDVEEGTSVSSNVKTDRNLVKKASSPSKNENPGESQLMG